MVTIKQIAEQAGVSTTTVSNVIHGKTKKVSAENIKKIQALILEMGYVRQKGSPVPHHDRSLLIAVVANAHKAYDDTLLADPFFGKTIGVIEQQLRQKGYYMMFFASRDIDDIFQMLLTWEVDGVITITLPQSSCEKMHTLINKPVVSIDAHLDFNHEKEVPNIGLDDREGGYLMGRYLLSQGYKNILVCTHKDYGNHHARWEGVQRAWQEDGAADKKLLQFEIIGDTWETRKAYYQQVYNKLPLKRKTALFFLSDYFALEAASYFMDQGVSVPEQIGIAGFDDISYSSRRPIPHLTTIHQDMEKRAEIAVSELIHSLEDENYRPADQVLPVSLVIRHSV